MEKKVAAWACAIAMIAPIIFLETMGHSYLVCLRREIKRLPSAKETSLFVGKNGFPGSVTGSGTEDKTKNVVPSRFLALVANSGPRDHLAIDVGPSANDRESEVRINACLCQNDEVYVTASFRQAKLTFYELKTRHYDSTTGIITLHWERVGPIDQTVIKYPWRIGSIIFFWLISTLIISQITFGDSLMIFCLSDKWLRCPR